MAGLVLVRRIFGLERLAINNEVAGFKFAVVGIVYGLLLTLATISAWDKFSEAHVAVIEEGAAANAIYQIANGPEEDQLAVRAALSKYLTLAIDKDWPAMEVEQESEEVSGALGELYADVIRLIQKASVAPARKIAPAQTKATGRAQKGAAVPTPNEVMAQALEIEVIKQLDNITKSRRTRVHLSSGHSSHDVVCFESRCHADRSVYILFWLGKYCRSSINDRYLGGHDMYVSPYYPIV